MGCLPSKAELTGKKNENFEMVRSVHLKYSISVI
jgi:hypothetical protein